MRFSSLPCLRVSPAGLFFRFLLAGLVFFSLALPLAAQSIQNFRPFTGLRTISTGYFTIIFPRESEATARRLSQFADQAYTRATQLLGIRTPVPIPVTITPHTDMFNGYMNPVPYPHIVLYDTPMDPEWASFENSLEGLFFHELCHVVSLSSRSPAFKVLHSIFGGWVSPTGLTAPQFMVEGVTVSFESLDGFGRANDPLTKQKLRQAAHEGKFLDPFQVSGVYDLPPDTAAYYEYGGLFSAWLQKTYGMEKYARLWQTMGRKLPFSFWVYRSGFYRIFTDVYGLPILEAWNNFRASLALSELEENTDEIPLKSSRSFVPVLKSNHTSILLLEPRKERVLLYDTKTKNLESLSSTDYSAYALGMAADGETFLVSGYSFSGDLAEARVREYRTGSGRRTGRSWEGLYKAEYFRDGLVALDSDLHTNNVVYAPFSGEREILLKGNEELLFSGPCALSSSWIVVTALVRGIRELWVYNYDERQAYRLCSSLPDDKERWRYMRDLRVSDGRVLFSYNHNDRMYKLASVDLSGIETGKETFEAVFSEAEFSGGVFSPVLVNGEIYYRSSFAERDGFLKFPETLAGLSGSAAGIRLVPVTGGPGEKSASAGMDAAGEDAAASAKTGTGSLAQSRAYIPFAYFNPLKFWIPIPLVRSEEGYFLSGGGLISLMMDPADRHFVLLTAAADIPPKMAQVDLEWQYNGFGIPLTLFFSDKVENMTHNSYRATRTSLTGALGRGLGTEKVYGTISGGLGVSFLADNPHNDSSAYTWKYEKPLYSAVLGMGLTSLIRYSHELFGRGISFNIYGRKTLNRDGLPRFDTVFRAALEPLGRLRLYGAWDESGMDLQGISRRYGTSQFGEFASVEYRSPASLNPVWLGGGELEFRIFSLEIQKHLSHLYYNRLSMTLACRNVMYDGKGHPDAEGLDLGGNLRLAQSAVMRVGLTASMLPIKAVTVRLNAGLWAAWKFSNTINGKKDAFALGPIINLNY